MTPTPAPALATPTASTTFGAPATCAGCRSSACQSTPPVQPARRRESPAGPGTFQVTERVRERLQGRFALRRRGVIDVKGKGSMPVYVLVGRQAGGSHPVDPGCTVGP